MSSFSSEPVLSETREDIPLNKSGSRSANCCSEDCLGGSRFINVAFATLTVVITIALVVQIYYGDYQVIPHGSVATDSLECSKIGTYILKKAGNAVDAAIASAFCLAVTNPYNTGLDAEGQLMIYNHRTRLPANIIDFAHVGSENLPKLAIGMAFAHQQYGSLPWKDLVEPAANLARNGYLISKILVQAINKAKVLDLYGRLEAGQMLKLPVLSETLIKIANIPEDDLYSYISNAPTITVALNSKFKKYDILVPNLPSIGPLLLRNLKEIEQFNFTEEDATKPEYIYAIAETTKLLYSEWNVSSNFDQSTVSNIAVIDLNDNYVSLVMGMHTLFGSGEMTEAGYVLDQKSSELKQSSRIPIVIIDSNVICGRRLVFGSSDIAIASQIIATLLIEEENATDSIEAPRFHMFSNGTIGIEGFHTPVFNEDILKHLEKLTSLPISVGEPYFSSNIVEKVKDDLSSHSDSRGGGIASRF